MKTMPTFSRYYKQLVNASLEWQVYDQRLHVRKLQSSPGYLQVGHVPSN